MTYSFLSTTFPSIIILSQARYVFDNFFDKRIENLKKEVVSNVFLEILVGLFHIKVVCTSGILQRVSGAKSSKTELERSITS